MSEELLLCRVQALKVCLAKTGGKRNNKELLSIFYKDGLQEDLYTNSLSVWVRELIHYVYQTAEGEVLLILYARTHEVCALAALQAFRGSMDTEVIFQPAWVYHLSFSDFCLQDITLLTEVLRCLGPIPATLCPSCSKILNKLKSFGVVVSFFTYANSSSL